MSKKWILLLGLACCTAIAGLVLAEDAEWDAEAAKSMPRAERLAAQQAFKAKMMDEARERGWVPGKRQPFAGIGRQAPLLNKSFGSITYDSGTLGTCCLGGNCIGNRFDSALNPAATNIAPVEMSGSITGAQFFMADIGGTAAFISVFDQLAGATANPVTSFLVGGMAAGTNTLTLGTAIPYVGSSFLAGVWQNGTGTGADRLAVATGTVGGQGYHGMSINDVAGTAYVSLSTLNATFRPSGDVLTPVELLNFDIE